MTLFASVDLITITSIISIFFIIKWTHSAFFGPLRNIPGPKRYSLFPVLLWYSLIRGDKWELVQHNLHVKYGPIVRVGPIEVYIGDKKAIKEMLVTKDFPKSWLYGSLQIFSESLFSSRNPEFVKKRRRILAPAFSIKYITSLEPLMRKCFEDVVAKIDQELASSAEGKGIILDVLQLNNQWTLDIIGETAFNGSFNLVKTGHHPLPEAIHKWMFLSLMQTVFPILRPLVRRMTYLHEIAHNLLNERRKHDSPKKLDILQQMLDADLPEEDLTVQIIEFLIAGSETSSFATTIALLLLVKHPEKLDRLSMELESEFGFSNGSKIPDIEILKRLPYLNAVINESMRILPVTLDFASNRITTEDWIVGEHLIPKGTIVSASILQLHLSTEYWGDDAHEFKPERWLDSEKVPKDVFYPFSAGSRSCIGMNFAMQELRMAIATFAYGYRMEEIPEQDSSIIQHITPKLKSQSYKIRFFAKH